MKYVLPDLDQFFKVKIVTMRASAKMHRSTFIDSDNLSANDPISKVIHTDLVLILKVKRN